MDTRSDILMRSGVVAFCSDCGTETIFVSVDCDDAGAGCEHCCTVCDAAVFLVDVGGSHQQLAARLAS